MFLMLASEQGHLQASTNVTIVTKELQQKEIEEAKRRAKAFTARGSDS